MWKCLGDPSHILSPPSVSLCPSVRREDRERDKTQLAVGWQRVQSRCRGSRSVRPTLGPHFPAADVVYWSFMAAFALHAHGIAKVVFVIIYRPELPSIDLSDHEDW